MTAEPLQNHSEVTKWCFLTLQAGADLPDIKADPEKVMLILQEKLRLDLDDEEAVQWIQQLINESASALMPAIMETTHRFAQYWR